MPSKFLRQAAHDLDRVGWVGTASLIRDAAEECEAYATLVAALTARAEKAEAELRTHLADGCATDLLPPMTTVLPDGTARRVVPHGSWLTKRNPDGSLHCNHGAHVSCPLTHETEITYRLASFEETDR